MFITYCSADSEEIHSKIYIFCGFRVFSLVNCKSIYLFILFVYFVLSISSRVLKVGTYSKNSTYNIRTAGADPGFQVRGGAHKKNRA